MNFEGVSTVEEVDEIIDQLLNRRREIQVVSKNALVMRIKERVQYYVCNSDQFKNEKLSEYLKAKLSMNPHYLANVFKKSEGISIKDFHIRLRIEEVKVFLKLGKYSLHEISVKLGYSSLPHLCNEFRRIAGINTFEWKKTHLKLAL